MIRNQLPEDFLIKKRKQKSNICFTFVPLSLIGYEPGYTVNHNSFI